MKISDGDWADSVLKHAKKGEGGYLIASWFLLTPLGEVFALDKVPLQPLCHDEKMEQDIRQIEDTLKIVVKRARIISPCKSHPWPAMKYAAYCWSTPRKPNSHWCTPGLEIKAHDAHDQSAFVYVYWHVQELLKRDAETWIRTP